MFVKLPFFFAISKFCLVYMFKAPLPNSNMKPKVRIKKKINGSYINGKTSNKVRNYWVEWDLKINNDKNNRWKSNNDKHHP